jgi:hypothetical protein
MKAESLYEDIEGDEPLLEAAEGYAEEFMEDYSDPNGAKAILEAAFLDGARWFKKNRSQQA